MFFFLILITLLSNEIYLMNQIQISIGTILFTDAHNRILLAINAFLSSTF